MKNYPVLSEADSTIMEILWSLKEATTKDVLSAAEKKLGWTRQTVKTYLDRLNEKGLIGIKKLSPRVYIYYPQVTKEEYASAMTGSYLRKYFDGLPHMMMGLIEQEDISDKELADLEQIIKDYRNRK